MARLQRILQSDVAPALMEEVRLQEPDADSRLEKVVVNVGAGDAKDNSKVIDSIIDDLTMITGQKAVPRRQKVGFELQAARRHIGAKVTLRGDRMYEFVDKFFSLALPRVRDFKGINPTRSTAAATIPADSRAAHFPPKSSTTRSIKSEAWDICCVDNGEYRRRGQRASTLLGAPFREITGRADRMAKTSMKIKQQRTQKYSTRAYNRCKICGRPHGYLRKFGICRICFRNLSYSGQIPV